MQSKKKVSGSRYGRAGAYFVWFLILLLICVLLYLAACRFPIQIKHMNVNPESISYQTYDIKDTSNGISYNLIGELVYEVLYDGLSEDEVMENMQMLGYPSHDVKKAVNELGIDWEHKALTNTESRYFRDLVESGIISTSGLIP